MSLVLAGLGLYFWRVRKVCARNIFKSLPQDDCFLARLDMFIIASANIFEMKLLAKVYDVLSTD